MRPQCDHILRTLGMVLATKYMPMLETDHARAEMGLTALILGVVSEEFERVAHRRIEENTEMRKIFKQAVSVVTDDGLKERLAEASEKTETDFHTSALDQLNCDLQEVLIELHTHVEDLEGDTARELEEAIWLELEKRVQRREFMTWEVASAMLAAAAEPAQEPDGG
jgi:hypothetical protein